MQYSPQQIKDRLLKALDEDNNVVDMAGVLAVISILESYTITREALEQTRIGRTINELRKKTNNEELAKRAKRLVRSWQKLVSSGQAESGTVNGEQGGGPPHPAVAMLQGSPRSRPSSPASVHSNISPGLPISRPGTPVTGSLKSSLSVSQFKRSRPNTPNCQPVRGPTNSGQRTNLSPKPPIIHGKPGVSANQNASLEKRSNSRTPSPLVGASNTLRTVSPALSSTPRLSPGSSAALSRKPDKSIKSQNVNHSNGNNTLSPTSPRSLNAKLDSKQVRKRTRTDGEAENSSSKRLLVHGVWRDGKDSVANNSTVSAMEKHGKDLKQTTMNGMVNSDGKPSGLKGFVKEGHYNAVAPSSSNKPATATSSSEDGTDNAAIGGNNNNGYSAKRNINFMIQSKSSPAGDLERFTDSKDRSVKPPKARVKTTAQLIAELQAKSDTVDRGMIARIAAVEREADDINQPVVPAGALPRARRKPHDSLGPMLPGSKGRGKLSQTKTELVEKFLQSSVTPSPIEDYSSFKFDNGNRVSPTSLSYHSNLDISLDASEASDEINARLHENSAAGRSDNVKHSSAELVDPLSLLPPLNVDDIVWDDEEYDVIRHEVTDSDVDRMLSEHWPGVNGCFDSAGSWRDWTETISAQSYDGEQLHILPYVNIDD